MKILEEQKDTQLFTKRNEEILESLKAESVDEKLKGYKSN
jgi:hypothetical protein